MIPNATSPIPIRTIEEQLLLLYRRRSAVIRLIRALERYQRLKSSRAPKKRRAA